MTMGRKTSRGFIIYLIVAFVCLTGIIVYCLAVPPEPAQTAYMNKESMFEIVSSDTEG